MKQYQLPKHTGSELVSEKDRSVMQGNSYYEQGDDENAIQYYNKALSLGLRYSELYAEIQAIAQDIDSKSIAPKKMPAREDSFDEYEEVPEERFEAFLNYVKKEADKEEARDKLQKEWESGLTSIAPDQAKILAQARRAYDAANFSKAISYFSQVQWPKKNDALIEYRAIYYKALTSGRWDKNSLARTEKVIQSFQKDDPHPIDSMYLAEALYKDDRSRQDYSPNKKARVLCEEAIRAVRPILNEYEKTASSPDAEGRAVAANARIHLWREIAACYDTYACMLKSDSAERREAAAIRRAYRDLVRGDTTSAPGAVYARDLQCVKPAKEDIKLSQPTWRERLGLVATSQTSTHALTSFSSKKDGKQAPVESEIPEPPVLQAADPVPTQAPVARAVSSSRNSPAAAASSSLSSFLKAVSLSRAPVVPHREQNIGQEQEMVDLSSAHRNQQGPQKPA